MIALYLPPSTGRGIRRKMTFNTPMGEPGGLFLLDTPCQSKYDAVNYLTINNVGGSSQEPIEWPRYSSMRLDKLVRFKGNFVLTVDSFPYIIGLHSLGSF